MPALRTPVRDLLPASVAGDVVLALDALKDGRLGGLETYRALELGGAGIDFGVEEVELCLSDSFSPWVSSSSSTSGSITVKEVSPEVFLVLFGVPGPGLTLPVAEDFLGVVAVRLLLPTRLTISSLVESSGTSLEGVVDLSDSLRLLLGVSNLATPVIVGTLAWSSLTSSTREAIGLELEFRKSPPERVRLLIVLALLSPGNS